MLKDTERPFEGNTDTLHDTMGRPEAAGSGPNIRTLEDRRDTMGRPELHGSGPKRRYSEQTKLGKTRVSSNLTM